MMFKFIDRPPCFADFEEKPSSWVQYGSSVAFQLSQRGNALEVHVGTLDKKGAFYIEEAGNALKVWAKRMYPWCECLLILTKIPSLEALCKKAGLVYLDSKEFEKGQLNIWVWRYE